MAESTSESPTENETQEKQPFFQPDNPLAAVPYGRPEVACFHNANVLDSGAHKVVAFGITGHGKSSFLNFVLKDEALEDKFETSVESLLDVGSVTKETQGCTAMIGGEQWMLIDTPGFFDTDQLQDGIDESCEAQVLQQKEEFYNNIKRAYLKAGKEVSAFLLVYNGATRWSLEMSQQVKFLNSIELPWSHCILVITHADAAFKGMPDEKRRYEEFIKAAGNQQSKFPEQLKKLMRDTSNRVILVESLREDNAGHHESVVTRMKDYTSKIQEEHGQYRNELFTSFGKKYSADCHKVYTSLLQDDKDKLQQLISVTKEDATGFARAGKKVVQNQKELIRMMEAIAQLADNQTVTCTPAPEEKRPAKTGEELPAVGIPFETTSSVNPSEFTGLHWGVPAVLKSLVSKVMAVAHAGSMSLMQSLKTRVEVIQAQSCLEQGQQALQELYSHYQSLVTKIDEAGLNQHPSASDSLVAHLLAVHAHDAQARSPEVLQAAQELSVFHTLRKAARGELTPEQTEKTSGNCALPIGFNILAATMDVSQAVGTTLGVVSISTNSTTMDATLLRSSCIRTLAKECKAIKTLCNIYP